MIGWRFGRLVIMEFSHKNENWQKYFKCRCDCGVEKIVRLSHLKDGTTLSCGCFGSERTKKSNKARRMDELDKKKNLIFSYFKGEAHRRKFQFILNREEAFQISQIDCHYCGAKPKNQLRLPWEGDDSVFIYNGIDRVDNSKGYVEGNMVPCCKDCNLAKRNLSVDEFLGLVSKIYSHSIEGLK